MGKFQRDISYNYSVEIDKPFCKIKMQLMECMVLDHELNAQSRQIALYLFLVHSNHETGVSWPSQETIGRALSLSGSTVKRAIKHPSFAKYVECAPGKNKGNSSRYRPTEYALKVATSNNSKGVRYDPLKENKGGQVWPERGSDVHDKGGHKWPPNREQEHKIKNRVFADANYTDEFSDFFDLYPRPGDKLETFNAYKAALNAGITHSQLIHAVKAYRDHNNNNIKSGSLQYIKYSNLWLKERYYDRYPMPKNSANMELICGVSPATIKGIQEGKVYMCRDVSASKAQELIAAGHVNYEQCRLVGLYV